DRRHRLFAVCCCRRIWHWMPDEQSRQAIAILELFADGQCAESDREVALTALLKQGDPLAALRGPQELAMYAALACAGANGKDGLRLAIEVAEDCAAAVASARGSLDPETYAAEQRAQCDFIRDMVPNPFRPVSFSPECRTSTAIALARQMYESRDFSAMPILADALQDAGCESADILGHCRGPGPHVRGCWVVDLVLGK